MHDVLFKLAFCEKCSSTEFFLVSIFLFLDWKQKNTGQKKLRIWALHVVSQCDTLFVIISVAGHNIDFHIGKIKIVEKARSNDFISNFSIKAFQKITLLNNFFTMKTKLGVTSFQHHQQRHLYNELYENRNNPLEP